MEGKGGKIGRREGKDRYRERNGSGVEWKGDREGRDGKRTPPPFKTSVYGTELGDTPSNTFQIIVTHAWMNSPESYCLRAEET